MNCISNIYGYCDSRKKIPLSLSKIISGTFIPANTTIIYSFSFNILDEQSSVMINFSIINLESENEFISIKVNYNEEFYQKNGDFIWNDKLKPGNYTVSITILKKNSQNLKNIFILNSLFIKNSNLGYALECQKCRKGSISKTFNNQTICKECPRGTTSDDQSNYLLIKQIHVSNVLKKK